MEEGKSLFLPGTMERFQREGEAVAFDPGKAQTTICRLFGISQVIEGIENAVVLVHGPKGCANYLQSEAFCINRKIRTILSTDVRESDVILGTEDALRTSIREVVDIYKPDLIVVLTTCATDIIGEDYSSVIKEMQDEVDCKLLHKAGGGFKAAYDQGYYDGYEMLVNAIMEPPAERKKGYVNIIGDLFPAGGSDTLELIRLIEGIGLKFNCNLVSGSTVEQIRTSQEAELNISKCNPTSHTVCELIEAKFGTPYFTPANPISIGATRNWIMGLARFFGKEEEAERFIEKEVKELHPIVERVKKKTEGKKAAINCGPGELPGLTRLVLELGIEPTFCFAHAYTKDTDNFLREIFDEYGINPMVEWEYSNIYTLREILPHVDFNVYLGTDTHKGYMYRRGIPVKCIAAYAMPLFGFKGVKRFALELEAMLDSPMRRLASRVCQDEYRNWRKIQT